MFLSDEDVFSASAFDIYNNIAEFDGKTGRLLTTLALNPFPRIQWHFESFSNDPDKLGMKPLESSIEGHEVIVEHAKGGLDFQRELSDSSYLVGYSGTAVSAKTGAYNRKFKHIKFYVPNAKCVSEAIKGSQTTKEFRVTHSKEEEPIVPDYPQSSYHGGWKCEIGDGWEVRIDLSRSKKNWHHEYYEKQGVEITAAIWLRPPNDDTEGNQPIAVSVDEARKKAEHICYLLTFANGGYLGPLMLIGRNYPDPVEFVALYGAYEVTSAESLSPSWLTLRSDLNEYLGCLPTFERMLHSSPWNKTYWLALIWYFQAIQPASPQLRGSPWPIVANALGALVERLSNTLLQELGERRPKGKPSEKILRLLTEMGVPLERYDDESILEVFFKVRNDATHPIERGGYSDEELFYSLNYVTMIAEEMLLWRIGYGGAYRDRRRKDGVFSFEQPRYKLRKRPLNW